MFKEVIDQANMLPSCKVHYLTVRNNESKEKNNKAGAALQWMLQGLWGTISNI